MSGRLTHERDLYGIVAVAGTVLLAGVSYVLANEPKGEGPLIIVRHLKLTP